MKLRDTANLQRALEYNFVRPELLERALTHTSRARELDAAEPVASNSTSKNPAGDNEQLEFLGDSVLGMLTTEELCRRFPHFREGKLSKLRAHLVSEKHLFQVANRLDLGDYLHLGRGEEKSGGRKKTAVLADALEALLAAVYLDAGIDTVRTLVVGRIIAPELEHIAREDGSLPLTDYKSALQEALQASARSQPDYVLVKECGPDHNKTFTVEVRLKQGRGARAEFVGRAEGSTKKNAEQGAAREALEYLSTIEDPAEATPGNPHP